MKILFTKRYRKSYVIVKGKNLYDQAIDSNVKGKEDIRKLTRGRDDDYATGCLLDYYYYIQNHYKLIAVDLSRQKIDADLKAIQQIDIVGQFIDSDRTQSIFILTISEKVK